MYYVLCNLSYGNGRENSQNTYTEVNFILFHHCIGHGYTVCNCFCTTDDPVVGANGHTLPRTSDTTKIIIVMKI